MPSGGFVKLFLVPDQRTSYIIILGAVFCAAIRLRKKVDLIYDSYVDHRLLPIGCPSI